MMALALGVRPPSVLALAALAALVTATPAAARIDVDSGLAAAASGPTQLRLTAATPSRGFDRAANICMDRVVRGGGAGAEVVQALRAHSRRVLVVRASGGIGTIETFGADLRRVGRPRPGVLEDALAQDAVVAWNPAVPGACFVLAHELVHAYLTLMGVRALYVDPASGIAEGELIASAVENDVRRALGGRQRLDYSGKRLPPWALAPGRPERPVSAGRSVHVTVDPGVPRAISPLLPTSPAGRIVSIPPGVNCGRPDCPRTAFRGRGAVRVMFLAIPGPHGVFTGWTGERCRPAWRPNPAGGEPRGVSQVCRVTFGPGDRGPYDLTAVFEPRWYTLTARAEGPGRVSGVGCQTAQATCRTRAPAGTTRDVVAHPDTSAELTTWEGCPDPNANPPVPGQTNRCTWTVAGEATVVARFQSTGDSGF